MRVLPGIHKLLHTSCSKGEGLCLACYFHSHQLHTCPMEPAKGSATGRPDAKIWLPGTYALFRQAKPMLITEKYYLLRRCGRHGLWRRSTAASVKSMTRCV